LLVLSPTIRLRLPIVGVITNNPSASRYHTCHAMRSALCAVPPRFNIF